MYELLNKSRTANERASDGKLLDDIRRMIEETCSAVAVTVNVGLTVCSTGASASVLNRRFSKENGLNLESQLSLHRRDNWRRTMAAVFLLKTSAT